MTPNYPARDKDEGAEMAYGRKPPTVYEEVFPNGIGTMNPEVWPVVAAICALGDEVRALREVQQRKLSLLEQDVEQRNENEIQRQDNARVGREQLEKMLGLQSQMVNKPTPTIGEILGRMPPPLSVAIPVRIQPPWCICGHVAHGENGCLVCYCKKFEEAPR